MRASGPVLRPRSWSLVAVAPLLLALACSGAGGGDPEGGAPAFSGALGGAGTSGSSPVGAAANTSALPGGTASAGAGGSSSSGSESGANGGIGLTPTSGQSAGQTQGAGGSAMAGTTPPAAGSAGAAGSGTTTPPATPTGSAGTSSMPPAGGTTPPVTTPPVAANANCPGQFFCDGFEGVAAGASPDAALWKVMDSYNLTTKPTATVQVSAANAHSGGQALRVLGAQMRSGAIATLPQSSYFLRAWLQVDAVPRGPVLMGLGTDQNDETRLRIFNQSWATINAALGDAVVPDGARTGNCPTCVTLVPNRWFCAEFAIDDAAKTATLYIDGVEAATLTGTSAQPASPQAFLGSMVLEGGTTGVWIDDVVAGPARIGCTN